MATTFYSNVYAVRRSMRDIFQCTRVQPPGIDRRIQAKPASVSQFRDWHLNMESTLLKLNGCVLPAQTIKFQGET